MRIYGVFEWIFWILAFGTGIFTLFRVEAFSTDGSERTRHHGGQQLFLWILTAALMVAGFLTAALDMRAGLVPYDR